MKIFVTSQPIFRAKKTIISSAVALVRANFESRILGPLKDSQYWLPYISLGFFRQDNELLLLNAACTRLESHFPLPKGRLFSSHVRYILAFYSSSSPENSLERYDKYLPVDVVPSLCSFYSRDLFTTSFFITFRCPEFVVVRANRALVFAFTTVGLISGDVL